MSIAATEAILPPGLESQVERVFAQAGSDLRLQSARIDATRVDAVVCATDGGCARLVLSSPTPCTDGSPAGPFCARWPGGAPPFAGRVEAAWARQRAGDFWRTEAAAEASELRAVSPEPQTAKLDGSVALVATALPLLVGGALMLGATRLARQPALRSWLALTVVVTLTGVALELGPQPLGVWDLAWTVALASFGAFLVAAGPARAGLIAAVLLPALGALELGLRQMPEPLQPSHPRWFTMLPWSSLDPHGADALGRTFQWQSYACQTMQHVAASSAQGGAPDARPTTLHLGDSLVHGMSIPFEETVVGRLNQLDQTMQHVRGAMPGTSIDAALVVLRNWGPILRPQRVVLHIYSGNDLQEIGADYPCCGNAPLLDWGSPDLKSACALSDPLLRPALANLLWSSPPPYAWRWLAPNVALAGHLCRGLVSMVHGSGTLWRAPLATRMARYSAALSALAAEAKAQRATLLVTLAPDAEVMRGNDEHLAARTAIRALLTEAGFGFWDGHAVLAKEWRQRGPAALLLRATPRDIHLDAEGHGLWASALLPWLQSQ